MLLPDSETIGDLISKDLLHRNLGTNETLYMVQHEKSAVWIRCPDESSGVWIYGSRLSVPVPYSTQQKHTPPSFIFCYTLAHSACDIWNKQGLVTSKPYYGIDLYVYELFDRSSNITRIIRLRLRSSVFYACRLYVSRSMFKKKTTWSRDVYSMHYLRLWSDAV